ncbi:MAG TPA: TonB-dependent receptor [Sphingobium sp.]
MTMKTIRLAATASILPFAALIASPAFAQADAAPAAQAADAADASGPGDIVVTARRRTEAVQDVPLSISVLTAAQVDQTGAYNVNRLQQLQPTLQFYSSNPRNSSINIRGIGAPLGLTNDGIEQGVGIYVDGVYYNRVASATLDFVDIEQVEVLRGPQGTLYGKNTTAGAINITTSEPSFNFGGKAELSVGNIGFKQAKATISGPLSDKLAVRLSSSFTDRDGTIYNVATNQRVNSQDNLGIRGTLLWKPTDTLKIYLTADYNLQNPVCCVQTFARVGTTQRAATRQYDALVAAYNAPANAANRNATYQTPSRNAFDRVTDLDAQLRARNELGGASLRAEWDLGAGTLSSVTAFRYWDWKPSNDRDFTGLPITTNSQNPTQQRQYTQELRYSQESDKIDFVVGAFAFYQTIRTQGLQQQGRASSLWNLTGTNPNNITANNPTGANALNPTILNGLRQINAIRLNNFSGALFGQLSWKVTDQFSIQPGLRLNYDKKDAFYDSRVIGSSPTGVERSISTVATPGEDIWAPLQRGVFTPQSYPAKYSQWNLSYDLTASYAFDRDILAYATYARSFKSGGVNLNGVPNDSSGVPRSDLATVKPEKVNHFEVGLKTQLWDRKITFNIDGFWTEIKDYQAVVNDGQTSTLRGYLANADKVRVRGIEADFSVRPSERLNLYANGAFTDHEYTSFNNAPCPPERSGGGNAPAGSGGGRPGVAGELSPLVCNISGQWLPGISKWAGSFGFEYNVPLSLYGKDGEIYFGYDGSYRSKFSSNASRSVYTDVDGYSLSNIRFGFRADNGLNFFGWVRNVFDQNYYEQLATTPSNTGLIAGQPGDPRTYGVTLKTNF